jgi:large subunit ribosomal protein L30
MAETIQVRLVRSPIGTKQHVHATLKGLGLGKVGSSRKLERTPEVLGMVRRVAHLVKVEEAGESATGSLVLEPGLASAPVKDAAPADIEPSPVGGSTPAPPLVEPVVTTAQVVDVAVEAPANAQAESEPNRTENETE